jgi:hypothetical protein
MGGIRIAAGGIIMLRWDILTEILPLPQTLLSLASLSNICRLYMGLLWCASPCMGWGFSSA